MNPVKLLQRLSKAIFAIAALVVLMGAMQAQAATYYVATDGQNTYSGTTQEWQGGTTGPWQTIAYAFAPANPNTVVSGDILYIEAGAYAEPLNITIDITIIVIWEFPATMVTVNSLTINPGAGKTVTIQNAGNGETLNVLAGGNLTFTSGSGNFAANTVVVPSGATVNLNGGNATGSAPIFGANISVVITAAGTYGAAVPTALGTGTFLSTVGVGTTATVSHGFSLTYSANAVQNTGAGTTTISGIVTYNGDSGAVTALNVPAGRMNVAGLVFHDDTAGIDALTINVAAGARLDVTADVTRPDEPGATQKPQVNLVNSGTTNFSGRSETHFTTNNAGGVLTFSGSPTLVGSNAGAGTIFINAGTTTFNNSNSTVLGDVNNTGTIVNNAGTTTLTFSWTGVYTLIGTINGTASTSAFTGVATIGLHVIAGNVTTSANFTFAAPGGTIGGTLTVAGGTATQAAPLMVVGSIAVNSAGVYALGANTLNVLMNLTLQQPPAGTNNLTTAGATLNFFNGATPADGTFLPYPGWTFTGGLFNVNKPGRTLTFQESVSIPAGNFTVATGVVDFTDEQVIMSGAGAQVITVNGITRSTTGGIDIRNALTTLGGSGQFTNIAINTGAALPASVLTFSSIVFNGSISLNTGALTIGPGFDLSAVAGTAPKIIRNTANASAQLLAPAPSTVGLNPVPYSVEYVGVAIPVAPSPNVPSGAELGNVSTPQPLNDLTFSHTGAVMVTVGRNVSLAGTLTVNAGAVVSGTAGTEVITLATANGTHTVAGLVTNAVGTLLINVVANETTINGVTTSGANIAELDALTINATGVSVVNIHAINGALTTGAGSTNSLTLRQDVDVDGDGVLDAGDDFDNGEVNGLITLNGTTFTLGARVLSTAGVTANAGTLAFGAHNLVLDAGNFTGAAGVVYTQTTGVLMLGYTPAAPTTDGAFTPAIFAGTITANGGSIDNVTVNEGLAFATTATVAKVLIVNAMITSGAAADALFLAGDGTFNSAGAWAGPGTFTTTGTNLTGTVGNITFTNFTVAATSNATFIDGIAGVVFPVFEVSGAFNQAGNIIVNATVVLEIDETVTGATDASYTHAGGTFTGAGTLRFVDDGVVNAPATADEHIPFMNTAATTFDVPNLVVGVAAGVSGIEGVKLTGAFSVSSTLGLIADELDHTTNAATSLTIGTGVAITRNLGAVSGTPTFTDGTTTVTYVNAVAITTAGELHTTVAAITTNPAVGGGGLGGIVTLLGATNTTVTGTFAAGASIVFGMNAMVTAATYTQTAGTTTFLIVAPATATTSTLTAGTINNSGGGIVGANGVAITANTLANMDATFTHPVGPAVATFTIGNGATLAISVNPAFIDPTVGRSSSYVLAGTYTLQFDGAFAGAIAGIDWPAAYIPATLNVYAGGTYQPSIVTAAFGSIAMPGNRTVVNLVFGNGLATQGVGSLNLVGFDLTVTGNVTQGLPGAGATNGAAVPVVDMTGLGAFIIGGTGNSTITVNPRGWESPAHNNAQGVTNWDGPFAPVAGAKANYVMTNNTVGFAASFGYSPNYRFVIAKAADTDQVMVTGGDLDLSLGSATNFFGAGVAPVVQQAVWVTNMVFIRGIVNNAAGKVRLYHGTTGAVPNQPVQGFAHCSTNPAHFACDLVVGRAWPTAIAATNDSHVATAVDKLSLSVPGAESLVGFGIFAGGDATAYARVHNSNITFPTGTLNPKYRPATLFFPTAPPADVNVTMVHAEGDPGGQNGFRNAAGVFTGIEAGSAGPITNYAQFFWTLKTDVSLAPSFTFEASFVANDYQLLPNTNIDDVRLLRRHSPVPDDTNNEWILQGGQYDNALDGNGFPTVTVRNAAIGGFVQSGIRFAIGERNQPPVANLAVAAAPVPQTTAMVDAGGGPVTVTVTDIDLAQVLNGSVTIAPALAAGAAAPTVAPASGASPVAFVISWTPGFDVVPGAYVITLSITDGSLTTTIDVPVVVTKTNRAPVFTQTLADGDVIEGAATTFTYVATDADADAIVYAIAPAVPGAAIDGATGAMTFTPAFAQAGTAIALTVTATDVSGGVATTTANLAVKHSVGLCDVTQNAACEDQDRDWVLQNSAGNRAFSNQQDWAGNVSGNPGTPAVPMVTAYDASLIAQWILGSITTFPAGDALSTKGGDFGYAEFAWGEADWSEGISARVPVVLAGEVDQVYAVTIRTNVDPTLARVESVQLDIPDDWSHVTAYDEETGDLTIVAAGAYPIESASDLASIQLTMVDEMAQLELTAEAFINEKAAVEIDPIAVRQVPTEYDLAQNYPNPFNPTTLITYSMPEDGRVTLEIYDVTGRLVNMLVNNDQAAGRYRVQWDGRTASGSSVASGIYIYRLRAGSFVQSKTMMLVK